jgi:hypothetical protein
MKQLLSLLAAACLCAGCGNNLAGPAGTPLLLPPGGLAALSVDSAHVRLSWTAASGAADTTFGGYILTWGTVIDTLARTAVQFTAGPLPRGATTFAIRSFQKDGHASDPAAITWAPAWRFDTAPFIITEYNAPQQTGIPGVDAGTGTTDPKAVGMLDANADSTLDFYLSGASNSPLQLLSAAIYNPGWHQTLFSSVTTASTDLNAPLPSFPADNTFTLQGVTLTDNMIYYVKTTGNAGEINYVRVHVHILPGSYPSRQVDIRISLQRVSHLPYA